MRITLIIIYHGKRILYYRHVISGCYIPSVFVRDDILPDAVLLRPTDHADVLLVLEVVLPVLSWPTGGFKVQLESQGLLRYYSYNNEN